LPDDAARLIARDLPVRDRAYLALAVRGFADPVWQSLACLRPLALQVSAVAQLPEGEPRLRAVLNAVFASAQPQLTAPQQAWLLRAAVVRTGLLQPPHRFVLHRLACEQCRHLPAGERAALVAVLAGQIPQLPRWLKAQEPPQPELGPMVHGLAEPSVPGQPRASILDAAMPSDAKTARAVDLARHFESEPGPPRWLIAVRREAFEDCRQLALELPAPLQSAPLEALAAQIGQLPMWNPDPHNPDRYGKVWRMVGLGVARILADTAALASKERLGVLKQLSLQIGKIPDQDGPVHKELRQQLRQHLADHPLERGHARTLKRSWCRLIATGGN
jgi:hypothetical protein